MGRALRLLDLYCCGGGASTGYARAGFDVTGVDIEPQPKYPYAFVLSDVFDLTPSFLRQFDVIAASPPCQFVAMTARLNDHPHRNLIPATRELLRLAGRPYIIENVEAAKAHLVEPIMLCGSMFGLGVTRHRLFESSLSLVAPPHTEDHRNQIGKMGRFPQESDKYMYVVGHFVDVKRARVAMGIDWLPRDKLAQAIPPAYTHYLGRQVYQHLRPGENCDV